MSDETPKGTMRDALNVVTLERNERERLMQLEQDKFDNDIDIESDKESFDMEAAEDQAQKERAEAKARKAASVAQKIDFDVESIDEFDEPDVFAEIKREVPEETCKVLRWVPSNRKHGDFTKIGCFAVLPLQSFQDKILTHNMVRPKNDPIKRAFMHDLGKKLVPRVITACDNGEKLQVSSKDGSTMFNIKGLCFTYNGFDEEKTQKFLEKRIVPAMKKYKRDNWTIKEEDLPKITIGGNEFKEVALLSDILDDKDDIFWVLNHETKGRWKTWGTRANIYNVWAEGKVPVSFIRSKGINKTLLLATDLKNYDDEYPEPQGPLDTYLKKRKASGST